MTRKTHLTLLMTVVLGLVAWTDTTHAAVLNFQQGVSPTAGYTMQSVTIRQNQANTNQNGSEQLIVGILASGNDLRALVSYDLSAITTAAAGNPIQINSVQLVLHTFSDPGQKDSDPGAATYELNIYEYGFSFDETTSTWNDPGTGDSTNGGTVTLPSLSSLAFDPTITNTDRIIPTTSAFETAVANALASSSNTLNLMLRSANSEALGSTSNPPGFNQFARLTSNDGTTAGNRPELIVDFTVIPEPGSLVLLAAGGVLMLSRRASK